MVKIKVIEIYQPNIFLGSDLSLFSKVSLEINKIDRSALSPSTNVTTNQIYLYNRNSQLFRIRVLSTLNDYTFKSLLIDNGSIEDIKKDKIYMIPLNTLKMDPSIKLFKIPGIVPSGLNIYTDGEDIKSKLSESKEWIRASYKFVCRIFEDSFDIHVTYIQEYSKDKALVDVIVNYKNQRESLKDLLIREQFAFAANDIVINGSNLSPVNGSNIFPVNGSNHSPVNGLNLSTVNGSNHFPVNGEEACDMERDTIIEISNGLGSSFDEILDINNINKVQSWLVSKNVEKTQNGQCLITYESKDSVRPIISFQKDPVIATFLKEAIESYKAKILFPIQTLMIPAILRGIDVMAIAPSLKGKSMGILMPILQKIATKSLSTLRSYSPLAIILCSSWTKVKQLTESSNIFVDFINESADLHKPTIVSAYNEQMEFKIMLPILEGCDILIITPNALSKLLKTHTFFTLNELEILALDDVDDLFYQYNEDIRNIFDFKESGTKESGNNVHHIFSAQRWSPRLESVIKRELGNMFLLTVNSPLDSAIIAGIKHKFIECDQGILNLYEKLNSYLGMKESTIHRTVIFGNDDKQIRSLIKFLSQKVPFEIKLMLGTMSSSELKETQTEWNHRRGSANMPILLISDEALSNYDVSIFNAQIIFHVDINPYMFSWRLNLLKNNFSDISFLGKSKEIRAYHSYIFMNVSGINLSKVNFLRDLFIRSKDDIPSCLHT